MHESVDDLDSFCCYQLTIAANLLLLVADKFVRTLLMLGTETYRRWVNQYQYYTSQIFVGQGLNLQYFIFFVY
jgi:hypothetical protein